MIQRDINGIYPLVICYIAIENGPVEIVDSPIKNGGSSHSFVTHYQRVIVKGNHHFLWEMVL